MSKLPYGELQMLWAISTSSGHYFTYDDEGEDDVAEALHSRGFIKVARRAMVCGTDTKYWDITDAGRQYLGVSET